jgi:5-methylcytosine-specific restriction enzyme A
MALRGAATSRPLMPLVRPCRRPWCPAYADETGWCPAHRQAPWGTSAPMPPGWPQLRLAILERDRWTCQLCGAEAADVDHIVPRAGGGPDDPSNLRSLCRPCHRTVTGRAAGTR